MRSTLQASSATALQSILDNYSNLLSVQNQLTTGQRVINVSDDPLAANDTMRYDTVISQINQFNSNIERADSFLGLTDSALSDVSDVINSARSLIIESASSTTTASAQSANASELETMRQELVSIANSQEGSRYLFGGTETTTEPFTILDSGYVCYNGNEDEVNLQIDYGTYMPINITGETAFGALTSTTESSPLSARINMTAGYSTKLSSLNGGNGVASGSVVIKYTGDTNTGLVIDLTTADTVEDVANLIEQASIDLADEYALLADYRQDYILQVDLTEAGTSLIITQYNRATSSLVDLSADPLATGIEVEELGSNTTAQDLGILGYGTTSGDSYKVGNSLDIIVTEDTLLADIQEYDGNPIYITNGDERDATRVSALDDTNGITDDWSLTGLTAGVNCSEDGEFYTRLSGTVGGVWTVDVFSGPEMLENQLIASGSGEDGTIILTSENKSGVSGTVDLNPPSLTIDTTFDIEMSASFCNTYEATVEVPAFIETGNDTAYTGFSTDELAGNWHISGLEKGVSTDSEGNVYVVINDTGADTTVELYSDSAHTNLVATGTLNNASSGTVALTGAAGYEDIYGSVYVENAPSDVAATIGGTHEMTITATFSTVEDLINAINYSGTYTDATISDDGNSLQITSRLSGAYLSVSENFQSVETNGDDNNQISQIALSGILAGINSDIYGNVFAEVVDNGDGTYSVNVYDDSTMQTLVATGTSTSTTGEVALEEVDDSGITGSLRLDYSADDDYIELAAGGGLSASGEGFSQISQIDISAIVPGVNSDVNGSLYVTIEDTGGGIDVLVYSDPSHNNFVASGTLAGTSGIVTLSEENSSGLGTAGNPASLYLDYTQDTDSLKISSSAMDISTTVREENIFSVIDDSIDAMALGDTEALSELTDGAKESLNRVIDARGVMGARQVRLELLSSRHEDSVVTFTSLKSNDIDLDYAETIVRYQQELNAYQASLQVTSQVVTMTLLDYIS